MGLVLVSVGVLLGALGSVVKYFHNKPFPPTQYACVVSMGVLNVSLYSLVCMCSLHACVCIRGCAFGTCTPSDHCRRLYRRIHKVLGYCAALLACACLYTGLGMTAPLASSSPCAALTVMRMCVWLCVARLDEQVI